MHAHDHHPHDEHAKASVRQSSVQKNLLQVLVLTSTYMVVEVLGGWLSGSLALLADAGHMAIDVGAIVLGLFAHWIARRPPTDEKTYGYYRAEILGALVNGAMLFAIAVGVCFEAWERFSDPRPVRGLVMTVVALGGLLVNGVGLVLMRGQHRHSLNMRGVWLHLLSDAFGSVAALLGGLAVWKLGWNSADPIVSIFIALLILFGAVGLLMECVDVLLEGVPRHIRLSEIREKIRAVPQVLDLHDLHVWQVASGIVALSAHIRLRDEKTSAVTLETLHNLLEKDFKISHVTLQLEPPTFEHSATELDCQKNS